jgi:hypothetical protein
MGRNFGIMAAPVEHLGQHLAVPAPGHVKRTQAGIGSTCPRLIHLCWRPAARLIRAISSPPAPLDEALPAAFLPCWRGDGLVNWSRCLLHLCPLSQRVSSPWIGEHTRGLVACKVLVTGVSASRGESGRRELEALQRLHRKAA